MKKIIAILMIVLTVLPIAGCKSGQNEPLQQKVEELENKANAEKEKKEAEKKEENKEDKAEKDGEEKVEDKKEDEK